MTDYAAKILALEDAVGSGELTVEANGERVTYRSMSDLLAALTYFRGQQAAALATPAVASTLATFSRD